MGFGEWSWGLIVSVGALVLGLAIAYGWVQWRIAAKNRTPAQQHERERKTRENFGKVEDPVGAEPERR